jgi:hypothetical protein
LEQGFRIEVLEKMNKECRDVEIDETPLGTMLASLRGY